MAKEILPAGLLKLIDELGTLPGVGARTAERYAYYLLRHSKKKTDSLSEAIADLHASVSYCPVTYALISSDESVSSLYSDSARDKTIVAVVEEPLDIVALERTGRYDGTYHVLGGAISPIDGIGPEQLHVPQLIERLRNDSVKEVIIATNASVEGESTALFLKRAIDESGLTPVISRLARGIPVGIDLEYADQITLSHALDGRKTL